MNHPQQRPQSKLADAQNPLESDSNSDSDPELDVKISRSRFPPSNASHDFESQKEAPADYTPAEAAEWLRLKSECTLAGAHYKGVEAIPKKDDECWSAKTKATHYCFAGHSVEGCRVVLEVCASTSREAPGGLRRDS